MFDRLLIVGLGSIGQRHATIMRELFPNAKIAVLSHRKSDTAILKKCGIDHPFLSIQEALQFEPQLALISNPASMHIDIALPFAKQGVHLLIEKPLSNKADGVIELLEACKQSSAVLMVGYNMRFLASLQKLKELIGESIIGKVLSVRAEVGQYLPNWRPTIDYRNTVSAKEALGGGVLLELSHEIDYLRWIFGEVSWVLGSLNRVGNLEIDTEDTANIIMGFERSDGLLVATVSLDMLRHDSSRSCTVIGEKGTLSWNSASGEIKVFKKGSVNWDVLFSSLQGANEKSYFSEWEHFLESIKNNKTPALDGKEGYAVLKIIDAIRESSKLEKKIRIKASDYQSNE